MSSKEDYDYADEEGADQYIDTFELEKDRDGIDVCIIFEIYVRLILQQFFVALWMFR